MPTGVVTFAFTDIEGSTARWARDRVAMQDAVRRHDAILRDAIVRHRGSVFKTIGDAFCSVFANAANAVDAMLAAQKRLAAEDFSAIDGLLVRVAIHTGSADERDADYFGPEVNRVARLLAIGHGGQILLSGKTAALVRGDLPAGVSLLDLGAYHLKDFTDPQPIHQLIASGLVAEFPPLRSLGSLPSDLSIVDSEKLYPVSGFSGRQEELATVDAALTSDYSIAVLHGLGGVGKSTIAREYAWRNRERYSVIWWLDAQNEEGIIDGLLRLGAMFQKGLDQLPERRAAAERVVNSLLRGFDKPILLVFDNLEDERLLRAWLPRTGARALVSSRDAFWGTDVTPIPVQTWDLDSAVGFLQQKCGRADLTEEDAEAIADAVGALPLALAHAAASLRNMRMVSARQYLKHIKEHLRKAPRNAEYPQSVFATFNTAIAQVESDAPGAAALLCLAASYAPDAIPDELFRQAAGTYALGLQPKVSEGTALQLHSVVGDEVRINEALGALDRLSLLTFANYPRTYSMHRLVQLAGRDLMGDASQEWHECAVDIVDAAFPEVEFATWPQCERLLLHARTALDALPSDAASIQAARLAESCSTYLRDRGEYGNAESLQTLALAIRERARGAENSDLARSLGNLAELYYEQGRYDEAGALQERALMIREKTLGPDHLDVSMSLDDLAMVYHKLERYKEAEALHLRAIAIQEKALGPDHTDVANALNHLAMVYRMQGRLEDAEALHARALAIEERALGSSHPYVAFSLTNLAIVYCDQGRYADAEPLYKRALSLREEVLGSDHPHIASSLNNLADVWREQGRYKEAEPFYLRAIAMKEKTLEPDSPQLAYSLNGLANVYREQGRYEEAELLHSRALTIWEKAFGRDHSNVADTLCNLASLYTKQGRTEKVQALYARAVAIREKALGPDHAKTREAREKLEKVQSTID